MFKDKSLEELVEVFFQISDHREEGFINAEELRKLLLKNLQSDEEKKVVKYLYKEFYKELNPKSEKGVTRDELYSIAVKD